MSHRMLITGFGRFPGAANNPSGDLALRLTVRRRPALHGVTREGYIFATSYVDVDREMDRLIREFKPQAILMFGVALRTSRLRIETQARNRMSLIFPDVDGVVPARPEISTDAARLPGRAPFRRLLAAARETHVRAVLSRDAGRYLCNYAYWRAVEASKRPGGPQLVAFIHVPKINSGSRKRGRRAALTMEKLIRAGEAIVVAAVSALRAQPKNSLPV